MRTLIAAGLLAASAGAAGAAEPQVSLTIYNNNLALVEDIRTLDIPAGRQRLEFKDVSAAIRPETVALQATGITIVEQNFDYDLLSPDKLMEKAVGQQVRIVRTNPGSGEQTTETATVLAVNEGVVLKIGERIEVLRDDGVPTRVIFDQVPENLRARPTLSVTVDAETAGPRQTRLSYLTTGLSWKADYVALFDEKAGKVDLQGWITLTNESGTSFADVQARLVAGEVALATDMADYVERMSRPARHGSGGQSDRAFADYYLYPLDQRTTIADNQAKQISFIDAKGVSAGKAYNYLAYGYQQDDEREHVNAAVKLTNAAAAGLGSELPEGIVRVYVRDAAGEPKFIGEDTIGHTPQGSDIELTTGQAFDVTVEWASVGYEKLSQDRVRRTLEYVLRNARREPVSVRVTHKGLRGRKLVSESLKSQGSGADGLTWLAVVPAQGETEFTFTVETDS